MAVGIEGDRVRARHVVEQGDQIYCALSWAEELRGAGRTSTRPTRGWRATTRFWRSWLGRARLPDHRWREPIQRSALTIKGLTYMPTGATVAALTTSLPETPGGERNWDYRFTWMRDSTFTLQALHFLNLDWEADEFMQFVADLEANEDGALQIMYGIDGRRDLTESTRDDLSGYAGARPVRIGNGAFDQRQNDVFGAVLDSILLHTRRSERLPRRLWPIVQSQAECATKVWREPDQGIWEARGKPQHYVSSKLMCWVAMDRAAKLAHNRGDTELNAAWGATADEIKEDILEHGLKDGVLRQHYETDALDASTLLAAIFGFLPRGRRAPAQERARDRRRPDRGRLRAALPDRRDRRRPVGQGGKLPDLLVLAGVRARDRRREPAGPGPDGASCCGSLRRWGSTRRSSTPSTGRHLGNFPQAFSHLALIEAAARIIVAGDAGRVLMTDHYDVIVIGTGAGGGTLVRHLAPSGKRILLLERGDWLTREPQNWDVHDVFVDSRYISPDTWYDADTVKGIPTSGALLRRRRDEALRRGALPPAREGLRRAPAPRRRIAGVADRLRRDGALLHAGRAALPGARGAGRGSDGAAVERSVPIPGGLARAPDPAALGRPRRRWASSVSRPLRGDAERGEHAVQQLRALRRPVTASRAWCTPSRTPRCSACGRRSSTRT